MERTELVLALSALILLLSAGLAAAAVSFGTEDRDSLRGTGEPDVQYELRGDGGEDMLYGQSGNGDIAGSSERGVMSGGSGEDRLDSRFFSGRERDVVSCGSGTDTVNADRFDRVAGDCERVRRL